MHNSINLTLFLMLGILISGCRKPAQPTSAEPKPKQDLGLPPLAGYWNFNGNSNDESGANIDLTYVGDPEYQESVSSGLGSALALDGDDGAIGTDFVKLTGGNATIVVWAKTTDITGIWNTLVKNWGTQDTGQFSFSIGPGSKETLHCRFAESSPPAHKVFQVTSPAPFPLGKWVHCAAVLDSAAGQHSLYINGQVVASAPYTAPIDQKSKASGLGIGVKPNNDGTGVAQQAEVGYWIGLIDEVGLYNAALSAENIDMIYRNGLDGVQLDGTSR